MQTQMADLFGIKKMIQHYDEEKTKIELFKSILNEESKGKRSLSIMFPDGAPEHLINLLRHYGFKAHNIMVKDPVKKDAKTCLIQW